MNAQAAATLFRERFGADPEWVAHAPGRVNLIGEHTDYSGGFVFPAAISLGVTVAAGAASGPCELVSDEMGAGTSFTLESLSPANPPEGWTCYPAGVAWALKARTPLRAAVVSDLPTGAGLSSSAAIELAFGVLWNEVDQLGRSPIELALAGQKAEHEFAKVQCGIMDQAASALGKAGSALFLDTRSLEHHTAPLPEDAQIIVCDTGKSRTLAGSAYNERRAQIEEAARIIGVDELRDAEEEDLAKLEGVLLQRARHVVTENQRCRDMVAALVRNDRPAIGQLMQESHISLARDYEVSCPELDAMAAAAWKQEGCIGARMTGAGFGGACIALVQTDAVEAFCEGIDRAYGTDHEELNWRLITCSADDGARLLPRSNI